jgi:tripartite-type tricarboxylate transporter receptor subunit TctC
MPLLKILAAAVALAAVPLTAQAQDWPDRPITMVVPFAAGGVYDTLGRVYAAALTDVLGRQVIVENVAGVGGMAGGARVARAAPDGYQVLFGGESPNSQSQLLHKEPLYDAATDFAPVVLAAEQPLILAVSNKLPPGNLADFIAYAKANQGKMQYGSPGVGAGSHLSCALFNVAVGIEVTHVPYRGLGPAMQDLIAGRIDYQCPVVTPVVPQIQAGLVKPIATLTKNRTPLAPDLPTAQEQGLIDFEAYMWFAIFLPKGTPDGIVRKLQRAVVAAENLPAVQERLKEIGSTPIAPERQTPEYLAAFVAREAAKWAGPVRASGVGLD